MRPLYGISLAVGFVALLVWATAVFASGSVEKWEAFDLEKRFGLNGRRLIAGLLGFGMAGLSASYAGWHAGLAAGAALAGVAVGVALAGTVNASE